MREERLSTVAAELFTGVYQVSHSEDILIQSQYLDFYIEAVFRPVIETSRYKVFVDVDKMMGAVDKTIE